MQTPSAAALRSPSPSNLSDTPSISLISSRSSSSGRRRRSPRATATPVKQGGSPLAGKTPGRKRAKRRSRKEKVAALTRYAREVLHWNLEELFDSIICEQHSGVDRIQRLFNTLQRQHVKERLQHHDGYNTLLRDVFSDDIIKIFQQELTSLEDSQLFTNWAPNKPPRDLNLQAGIKSLSNTAPLLCGLLSSLMKSTRICADKEAIDSLSSPGPRHLMLLSLISFSRRPQICNMLPKLLGVYLHCSGAKRRVINVLNSLGICSSYTTVSRTLKIVAEQSVAQIAKAHTWPNLGVVYNSFDYNEKVGRQTQGHHNELKSITSGLLIECWDIPDGGLLQSMLNTTIPLDPRVMFLSPGLKYDDVQLKAAKYLIFTTLNRAFPDSLPAAMKRDPTLQPQMPVLDVLPVRKTVTTPLGPMFYNGGTLDGAYDVLKSILVTQTGHKDDDFARRLFLVYGDQKTVSFIRSLQSEQQDSGDVYGRHQWALPAPGWFHYCMNYIFTIWKNHYGAKHCQSIACLYAQCNVWGRRELPLKRPPFDQAKDLVQDSFNSRIVAAFLGLLTRNGVKLVNKKLTLRQVVCNYMASLKVDELDSLIQEIYEQFFSLRAQAPDHNIDDLKDDAGNPIDDQVHRNNVRFMYMAETYSILNYAVKHADIGLIERMIDRCGSDFLGSNQTNYSAEVVRLIWLFRSGAASPALKKAILSNSLVNERGLPDSWYAIDQKNELLNRDLKNELRNSTFDTKVLSEQTALSIQYAVEVAKEVEKTMGEHSNSDYTERDPTGDWLVLAKLLMDDNCVTFRPERGRRCGYTATNLSKNAVSKIISAVDEFNRTTISTPGRLQEPPIIVEVAED